MGVIVRNVLFLLAIFGTVSHWSCAQSVSSKYDFVATDKKSGDKVDFEQWVQTDLLATRENPCEPTFGYFVFRVHKSGLVDSVQYFGNLEQRISEHIANRIRISEEGWVTKGKKSKFDYQWFIFPYYDFGPDRYTTSNCSPEDKAKQKLLIDVAEKLAAVWVTTISHNVNLLYVSKNGGGYSKF